ncbi:MAG TPA: hypothetical protein VFP39_01805, partial [Gemmatimonadales bacterium]|nr:hypothetical protein [Gemmatimonadales bacterium]
MFGAFVLALLVAGLSWLVRARKISPFSAVGRGMRNLTDPVINPIERVVVRRGGNPVQAGWWLVILVAVIGVVVLAIAQFVLESGRRLALAAALGPRALIA